jgi:hypothetical protein
MLKMNIAAVSVSTLMLLACGGDEAAAKKAVLDRLKDPESARFGKFSLAGKDGACLTINAKNAMGGYTGDQQAYLTRVGEKDWSVMLFDKNLSNERCVEIFSK